MPDSADDISQEREWSSLYALVEKVLRRFGKEDAYGEADYSLLDENWGDRQQKVLVDNLNLLAPTAVSALQACLAEFPDWEIVMTVGGADKSWPDMGLTIRSHEIIDDLQRQYFPKEFQAWEYEGARKPPSVVFTTLARRAG